MVTDSPNTSSELVRLQAGLALFLLLCGIYLGCYKGAPISDDELMLLSGTDAVAREQEFALYSMFDRQDILLRSSHEPLQAILAVPLFWIAQHVDGVGIVHTVWLFNLLVVALTCTVLYWGSTSLGFPLVASWLTALVMGTATILLPYSQSFFREPLAGLGILLGILLSYHLRENWNIGLATALLLVCAAIFLTKVTAFVAFLIVLGFILFPKVQIRYTNRHIMMIIAGTLLLLTLLFLVRVILPSNNRFNPDHYLEKLRHSSVDYFFTVLTAYLFSPGRSVWAGSPILLLSLYGAWLSYRQNRFCFAIAPLLLLLVTTIIYGLGTVEWHGGRGWGTRYLVPTVPAMSLLLVPVITQMIRRDGKRVWQFAATVLLLFSIVVQAGSALMPLDTFYSWMGSTFQENALNSFYEEGTWQVGYTPWFIHLKQFDLSLSDVAWNTVAEPGWHVGLGAILLIIAALLLLWDTRQNHTRSNVMIKISATVLVIVASFTLALKSLYHDPRLQGNNPDLFKLVEALETQEGEDDIIYLANPTYRLFFMNYYKGPNIWVTLPIAVGERFSETQIPQHDSVVIEEQLSENSTEILKYGIAHYKQVWVVENQSPYHWWANRPAEHWLTKHTYPFAAVDIQPTVRLIGFYAQYAPAWIVHYGEQSGQFDYRLNSSFPPNVACQFGSELILSNVLVPEEVSSGDVLPVSLNWKVTAEVPTDYHIGLFLLNADGVPVATRNSPPQSAFGDMRSWFSSDLPSQIDNHGLLIPKQVVPGAYTLGMVVYDWRDSSRLPAECEQNDVSNNLVVLTQIMVR